VSFFVSVTNAGQALSNFSGRIMALSAIMVRMMALCFDLIYQRHTHNQDEKCYHQVLHGCLFCYLFMV